MAQKWYEKATVQAAIAGGFFVLLAAVITTLLPLYLNNNRPPEDSDTFETWEGMWEHTSRGPDGNIVTGTMQLSITEKSRVSGRYKNNAPSEGELEGKFFKNGLRIEGRWKNKKKQAGRFIFDLGADRLFFKGYYSIGEIPPETNPFNFWDGKKIGTE